ncbi:MAG: Peptide chain release factor 1 [Candidatus Hydrogenedentes bacterium ADurb.Bin179]|nr:MAG: Peptide chain release factor 1 [Candidatus Hydrogenedentes bacterium ADurb.Bin179]
MQNFGVTPEKMQALEERMAQCGIRDEDLKESFIRSGGPGGQKVNRSETCVALVHLPSGRAVKMQRARSQALNRFYARRRLCELIEKDLLGGASAEAKKAAKVKKQKARRRRRQRKGTLE